jgi:hypothetical protein
VGTIDSDESSDGKGMVSGINIDSSVREVSWGPGLNGLEIRIAGVTAGEGVGEYRGLSAR